MVIVQSKLSVIDKLYLLWSLCLIDHYNSIGKKKSRNNVEEEFGKRNADRFDLYCDIAHQMHYLDQLTMRLTPTGLKAVANWQSISNKLYTV